MKHKKNSKNEIVMKFQKGSKSVKRTILVVVFMAFSICMTQGQTPLADEDGNVTLYTQTQVDGFNHSSISGYLLLNDGLSDFIMNLNGLSSLTSVGGILGIARIRDLTSLSGLDNLTSVGGKLNIASNRSLISLAGLESLSSVGGELYIGRNEAGDNISNPALVDFCAISDLVTSDSTNEYFVANNGYNPTHIQIQSVATCSLAGSNTLNKIYTYSTSGTGSSGMTLTLAELNSIGITGTIAANLEAYNAAIKIKVNFTNPATNSVATLAELQMLITDVNNRPVVGLSEYSSKSLVRLSPNPAIGFVRFFGLSSEEGYVIYNTLGVAVQSGIVFSEEKIIIESLPAGLYFLKLGNLEVFKFLKE